MSEWIPPIKAVCFDCFGTLMQITQAEHGYKHLISGHPNPRSAREQVMTIPRTLAGHARAMDIAGPLVHEAEALLHTELDSIKLYDDAMTTLAALRAAGVKLALCSNLAFEFGVRARELLTNQFDVEILSYEVGLLKPDYRIFQLVAKRLELPPSCILMVGDSEISDEGGARRAGLRGAWLRRGVPARRGSHIEQLGTVLEWVARS